MNRLALNPAYPPRRPPSVQRDLRQTAPWISLTPHQFHAIVTTISRKA